MYRKTKTSSFGSIVRESHDSSKFYASKFFDEFEIPKKVEYVENEIPYYLLLNKKKIIDKH